MNQFIVYLALVLVGACLGSFAGATVWRLRAKQLTLDKKNKDPYDHEEYQRLKKLTGKKTTEDRSQCLECGYALKWYDLIPIVSWLTLRGKCRACKHPIGWFEPLIEISMVAYFVLSYMLWPGGVETGLQIAHFGLWLAAGVAMAILFAYDAKWFLLPDVATLALAIIGLGIVGVSAAETQDVTGTIFTAVAAVGVLGGLYGVLYAVSKGRWVGFGDVKLGAALGLILVDWQLAAVALFLANLIGCLIVIPLLATKKVKRTTHIPFGPMLIAGSIIAWLIGWNVLDWYLSILGV
ncbi:MAG: prepilin peptidase [Candidatus Saccharimonadaceae bacterium]